MKNSIKKSKINGFIIYAFRIIFFLFFLGGFSQGASNIPEIVSPSPDAISLGKYGMIPVSKFTGVPNIKVPIYTMDFDGLQIPIELSYHASGIRVSEESSWVGLGWTLTANSIITRQVNGMSDVQYPHGYVYQSPLPNSITQNIANEYLTKTFYGEYQKQYDTRPDIFVVNLFGQTAKFTLTKKVENNGKIGVMMLNENRSQIEYNESTKSFMITNDQGFQFYFNTKEYSSTVSASKGTSFNPEDTNGGINMGNIERSAYEAEQEPIDGDLYNRVITGWYLDRIVSPKSREINFEYLSKINGEDIYTFSAPYYSHTYTRPCLGSVGNPSSTNPSYSVSSSQSIVHSVYLSKITSDKEDIIFSLGERDDLTNIDHPTSFYTYNKGNNNTPKRLTALKIKNKQGKEIIDTQFYQSYYNASFGNRTNKNLYLRLKLDGIRINEKSYGFEYNADDLPIKTSSGRDFWGYNNGKVDNKMRFPKVYGLPSCSTSSQSSDFLKKTYNGADNLVDPDHTKKGILTKIIYPTKGYTSFEYENNTVTLDLNSDRDLISYRYLFFGLSSEYLKQIGFGYTNTDSGYGFDTPKPTTYFSVYEGGPSKLTLRISCQSYACDETGGTIRLIRPNQSPYTFGHTFDLNENPQTVTKTFENLPEGDYALEWSIKRSSSIGASGFTPLQNPFRLYESNAGGLRIKHIKNYDSNDVLLGHKEYTYTKNRVDGKKISSGTLINDILFNTYEGNGSLNTGSTVGGINSFTGNMMNTFQDYNVGYAKVEEIHNSTKNSQTNGTILTDFYIQKNNNSLPPNRLGIDFPTIPNIKNGMIHKERYLKRKTNDFDFTVLKEVVNDYNIVTNESEYSSGAYFYGSRPFSQQVLNLNVPNVSYLWIPAHSSYIYYVPFKYKREILLNRSETTIDYFDDKAVETKKTYSYNEKYLPESTTVTSSDNDKALINYTYYPFDQEDNVSNLPYMSDLVSQNRITEPILSKTYRGNDLIQTQLTNYNKGVTTSNLVLPKSLAIAKGVITNENPLTESVMFEKYDDKGNILQYKKTNGMVTSYVWSYNKIYPVAKIENATFLEVAIALGISENALINFSDNSLSSLNSLRTSLPSAMITTYMYEPLIGMINETSPKGYKMEYIYDEFNRLEFVKDHEGKLISENKYNYKN
ncbi:hypothetical protein [Aquimarina algiphila]|uniref:hypothetical protein n=1 Tax=Aquimarina algiphila TaxID=2047982 RepID=UPI00232BF38D|nr:hypothetical protein [Aquimarina algiphila]